MAGSIRVRDTHQKEFVRLVDGLSGRYSRWTIWADFITMAAISLSNAVDKSNAESREETYKHIEEKYTPNELPLFAQMFAEVVMGLDENPDQDFLGELYMNLDLGNEHAGQFFTPYNVCRMMSEMNVSDVKKVVADKGWISVLDCCCGAGALLVAFANTCKRNEINYQECVLFAAQDIDYIVGMMCYIQLSLLGASGYVVIGDSLSKPMRFYDKRGLIPVHGPNIWYTPFFFRKEWDIRRTLARMETLLLSGENRKRRGPEIVEKNSNEQKDKALEPLMEIRETEYGQLTLF